MPRWMLLIPMLLLPALAAAKPLGFSIGTSKPVLVDTSGGVPRVWLDFGGGEVRAATYRGGSGTQVLEFAYDVVAGDFAPSGIIAAGEIDLAGGAIRDAAGNPLTLTFTPPDLSGVKVQTYRAAWTTDPVTAANAASTAFQITKPPPGASFAWQIASDGGGTLSGSGTIAASPHPVTGLDLGALADGTLTLTVTLTTPAGTGAARTATVAKDTGLDCTDPAILAAATPGARCAGGAIYAGSLSGKHLITHVSGCGYEPGGTSTTKASATFTPTCTGTTDSTTKRWASHNNAIEIHSSGTSASNGAYNTEKLMFDTQRPNYAAAYCHHLSLNGQTDWYLPATDELNVLYVNRSAIGGFAESWYWTSQETGTGSARILNFGTGAFSFGDKGATNAPIRCVRLGPPPPPPPTGYTVGFVSGRVSAQNAASASFRITAPELGLGYTYEITSSGGEGSVSGSGTAWPMVWHDKTYALISGIDLSGLADGTLTLSVVLSNAGGSGPTATATAPKQTIPIDCTDTGALVTAGPGAACADGSIYAGSLSGSHLFTHLPGCGFEPSGTTSTKAAASFVPACTSTLDSTTKRWSDSTGVNEGTTSLTDGRLTTNQVLSDSQRLNPAAAYCFHMDLNGWTDWYLPARDELNVLFMNRAAIGGFTGDQYWTSSEVHGNNAWVQSFGGGNMSNTSKADTRRLRCVRTPTPPPAAPSGYGVAWASDFGVPAGVGAASFQITGAEVGAAFSYAVTSSGGGGSVRGAGVVTSATHGVSGLDLWVLPDGILTVSVVLTNAGGSGAVATASAERITVPVDCADTGVLATAPKGSRCTDGSIYAGAFGGSYLITHVSGCGHEPGGHQDSKPGAAFTPTCTGATDSINKQWASSDGATEGATSLTDGLANTGQLLADTQRLNPAAAYCQQMVVNGRTDWYLPALNEQNVLYVNQYAIGGFAGGAMYWSSTEGDSSGARGHIFGNGSQQHLFKRWHYRIRCIRRVN